MSLVHLIVCNNNVQEPMEKSRFVITIIPHIRCFSNLITTTKGKHNLLRTKLNIDRYNLEIIQNFSSINFVYSKVYN